MLAFFLRGLAFGITRRLVERLLDGSHDAAKAQKAQVKTQRAQARHDAPANARRAAVDDFYGRRS